jgi:hypothetical protein
MKNETEFDITTPENIDFYKLKNKTEVTAGSKYIHTLIYKSKKNKTEYDSFLAVPEEDWILLSDSIETI